jgi:hypothetical protein
MVLNEAGALLNLEITAGLYAEHEALLKGYFMGIFIVLDLLFKDDK